jgi:hypothetical protein
MFRSRSRFAPRQIHVGGFVLVTFLLWLLLRGGERVSRHKSPYAASSRYIGSDDVLPIVDVTIQECTRWRWFEKRSRCTALLDQGWQVSGGDLLLDKGKHRVHLFVKRQSFAELRMAVTDIRVAQRPPSEDESWEARPGGIWINRRMVTTLRDAVTAVDYIHGRRIRELRRGRQFALGGPLLLGQEINLSFRKGKPPPREMPILKVKDGRPYKVLQVAGIASS